MNGVRAPPFDEDDVDDAVRKSWRVDQLLGSYMEHWVTREVPEGHCRFCNDPHGSDPVENGRQRFCDEDCHEEFEKVFKARLALGRRDMDQRGYD
jgi:predicted nucleic acid-binding Zn ribbon protein